MVSTGPRKTIHLLEARLVDRWPTDKRVLVDGMETVVKVVVVAREPWHRRLRQVRRPTTDGGLHLHPDTDTATVCGRTYHEEFCSFTAVYLNHTDNWVSASLACFVLYPE